MAIMRVSESEVGGENFGVDYIAGLVLHELEEANGDFIMAKDVVAQDVLLVGVILGEVGELV